MNKPLTGKPKMLWFAYPNNTKWAFEIRTYALVNMLSDFDHMVLLPVRNLKFVEAIIDTVDIVMVWNDMIYNELEEHNKCKIIQYLSGMRMFKKVQHADNNKIYINHQLEAVNRILEKAKSINEHIT
jgi:hypothetical protein